MPYAYNLREAEASPSEILTVDVDLTYSVFPEKRSLVLMSGDQIIQFTQPSIIIDDDNTPAEIHTKARLAGTASGDLVGTIDIRFNTLLILSGGYAGRGYTVGTFTFDDGSGNIVKGVIALDNSVFGVLNGFMVSTYESGIYSGCKIMGNFSGAHYDLDGDSVYERVMGTATLRLYSPREVFGPYYVDVSGIITAGNDRDFTMLTNDEIVQFTRSDIALPNDITTYLEEGQTTDASTSGWLTGTLNVNSNQLFLYPGEPPTPLSNEGWIVGKFSYSDAYGSISGIILLDGLGFTGPPYIFNIQGYTFALVVNTVTGRYKGFEYFGEFTGITELIDVGPPRKMALAGSVELKRMRLLPVGGVWIPINPLELLAPWISWASLLTVAAISIIYLRYRRKRET